MTISVITGGTGGIGLAVATALHQRGDELVLLGRDQDRLTALARSFPGSRTIRADLGRPTELAAALTTLPDRIDVLVHSAGTVTLGRIGEATAQDWERTLTVNLTGPAELTRLALPGLRAAHGHVVMINSGAGLHAGPQWGSYAASKFGLRALADALRAEEAAAGVRVTTIYPGRTASAMQATVHAQEGRAYEPSRWIQPASVATTVLMALSLPRDADVTELTVRPSGG